MRPISEIRADIKRTEEEYREELLNYNMEIEEIQELCPHPKNLLIVDTEDSFDEAGGPGIYEFTYASIKCTLCEKVVNTKYDKHDQRRSTPYADYRPDFVELFRQN